MQAKETKLQDIIEGTKQYLIPLFQRTYSWTIKEWDVLWKDICELYETENPRTHFIGSIVNMPTVSVPEGVAKYLLIDGQQRLTTIFIFLTLLRNTARNSDNARFAEEINNTLLVNQYKDGLDYYKLLPTQIDRIAYQNLVDGNPNIHSNQLSQAYNYFERKLNQSVLNLEKLKKIVTNYFSIVSIVLDTEDNPYLVFESLNAKGRPLTQADLIRNYFFMRIHVDKQDEVYNLYWHPMQIALGEKLTEFIRHFLMMAGSNIKQGEVYNSLKVKVTPSNAIGYLKELKTLSLYYERLIAPEKEPDPLLRKYFKRLNRIEVTTAYPLLLNFYNNYATGILDRQDFISILQIFENYLIRRFVCNIPSNQLNKIFASIYSQISTNTSLAILESFKMALQDKGYPKDNEFILNFKQARFYGGGDRAAKTRLILETFEEFCGHKEQVAFEDLSIEHVMPQTLSEWWQRHLGSEWEETHELYLHAIGNLTLTAYNSELSNENFLVKKKRLYDSHLELNTYFNLRDRWTKVEIEQRADLLSKQAIIIWKYFGEENSTSKRIEGVTGTIPLSLKILGQTFQVQSWRDIFQQVLETIADLEPEKFDIIAYNFPKYVGKDRNKFRAIRELRNGYFIEMNLSAEHIQRLCRQALSIIELSSDDWSIQLR